MRTRLLRFATYLAPSVEPVYRAIAAYVGERLGFETELVRGRDLAAFAEGEEHVGFMCSPPYVALADRDEPLAEAIAAPILSGERYAGRPVYFSDVIVRRDDPAEAFADLRGRDWAFNEPWSFSGYGVVRAHLGRLGERAGYFGRVVACGFHQRAIGLVRRGRVDGAAIDSQVLELAMRDDPGVAEDLRVVESLGPSPIQPVVAHTVLPPPLREDIREALVAMGEDPAARPALDRGLVERFVPVGDKDYDPIREAISIGDGVVLAPTGR